MNNQTCIQEAINLTKSLVALDTSKSRGQKAALQIITQWAKANSLSVKQISGTQALLVQTKPLVKKSFAFVCHIDVVPAAGWKEAFTPTVRGGALYGRGTVDDKGPLSICLAVLAASKDLPDVNVSCLIVSDEETENADIQGVLSTAEFKPDYCLVVDGGTHQQFDIGQKGIVRLSVKVTAAGGHSAFEEAEKSAAITLLRFLRSLEAYAETLPTESHFQPTFFNISSLHTETVSYGLPTVATANLEIQFPPPQTLEQWLEKINELQVGVDGSEVKIAFTEIPHLVTDQSILAPIQQLPGVSLITVGGVNLAKDLNKAGIPAVGHCPVETYMGHCDNENIKLSDFEQGIKTYQTLIHLWRQQSGNKKDGRNQSFKESGDEG